jgi:hypothetical protein
LGIDGRGSTVDWRRVVGYFVIRPHTGSVSGRIASMP